MKIKSFDIPKKICERIYMAVTNKTKVQVFLEWNLENIIAGENFINSSQGKIFFEKIRAYASGVPIEYILQEAEFYGINFYWNHNILIPREETERIIDIIISKNKKYSTLIDVWTGTWNIPITLIKEGLQVDKVFAIDISLKALEVAQKNAKIHNVNIEFLHSSLLDNFLEKENLSGSICITANLPYIKDGDYENMSLSVIEHEPSSALYGWPETGFELYEKLIEQCQEIKKNIPNLTIDLVIEIGFDQYSHSKKFLENTWLIHSFYSDEYEYQIQRNIFITF